VLVEIPGEDDLVFTLTRVRQGAGNRVLSFGPRNGPVRMVAATEAEADADLPLSERECELAKVLDTALLYFKALTGEEVRDALEKATDWAAMREEMTKDLPALVALNDALFAAQVLKSLQGAPLKQWKDRLPLLSNLLTVEMEGESASVALAGMESNPVRLRRIQGKWMFTRFAR
jgi:hypothetical protein